MLPVGAVTLKTIRATTSALTSPLHAKPTEKPEISYENFYVASSRSLSNLFDIEIKHKNTFENVADLCIFDGMYIFKMFEECHIANAFNYVAVYS